MATTELISPRVLAWARESAGFTVEEAAEKLALGNSARASAVDKLSELESGQRHPTSAQLLKAAALYKRPLVAFYLAEPPAKAERGEDFRVTAAPVSKREDAILDAMIRDIKARQQMVRALLEDEEEAHLLPFVGSASTEDDPAEVAERIRAALGVSEREQKSAKGPDALFATLRLAIERLGVFVLLLGDAGSHHSAISEQVFRGFVIADDVAPFIVINDRDARTARSFTLMHELAHIWLGTSGVSGPIRRVSASSVERFCNDTAGEFLLPSSALQVAPDLQGADAAAVLAATDRVAQVWNVSQALVTYRFARKRWISDDTAGTVFGLLADRWRHERERTRADQPDTGGPSYYVVRRSRLGKALLNAVRRGLQGEVLTHTRAAKILGVKAASVGALLDYPMSAR